MLETRKLMGLYSMNKSVLLALMGLSTLFCFNAKAQDPFLTDGYTPFNRSGPPPKVALPSPRTHSSASLPAPLTVRDASKPKPPAETRKNDTPQKPPNGAITKPPEPQTSAEIDRSAHIGVPVTAKPEVSTGYVPGMTLIGVAEVYDGHSLSVDGHPVRLHGIDAPGMGQTCKTASMTVWSCGRSSYERLYSLFNGKKLACVVSAQAGHGAAVRCSGLGVKDIAALIVSEGWAIPNRSGYSEYRGYSDLAKQSKRGVWVGFFENPSDWRKKNR